jgi:hypothetical protein
MKSQQVKNHYSAGSGLLLIIFLCLLLVSGQLLAQNQGSGNETRQLQIFHQISSQALYDWVKELSSEKYQGRLTGTDGFNQAASWVSSLLASWGVKPAGDNGTYLQAFPAPYTLVLDRGEVSLHLPVTVPGSKKSGEIKKYYRYEDEYFPGGTSASGEITAEVVYAGFGITAPELGYDDYQGVDVRGKIVLMESEVPVSPDKDPETFKKWRPYSFHQYKLQNAAAHGLRDCFIVMGRSSIPIMIILTVLSTAMLGRRWPRMSLPGAVKPTGKQLLLSVKILNPGPSGLAKFLPSKTKPSITRRARALTCWPG